MFATKNLDINKLRQYNQSKCLRDFSAMTQVIEEAYEVMRELSQFISTAGKNYLKHVEFQVNHILFARTMETILCAYDHTLTGEYGTVKALIRMILENSFFMKYFATYPLQAQKWFTKKFRWGKVVKSVSGPLKAPQVQKFYKALCNYIHPNIKGCGEYFKASTVLINGVEQSKIFVRVAPLYDKEQAEGCLRLLIYSIYYSIDPLLETFKMYILQDDRIKQRLTDLEQRMKPFLP